MSVVVSAFLPNVIYQTSRTLSFLASRLATDAPYFYFIPSVRRRRRGRSSLQSVARAAAMLIRDCYMVTKIPRTGMGSKCTSYPKARYALTLGPSRTHTTHKDKQTSTPSPRLYVYEYEDTASTLSFEAATKCPTRSRPEHRPIFLSQIGEGYHIRLRSRTDSREGEGKGVSQRPSALARAMMTVVRRSVSQSRRREGCKGIA